MNKCMSDSMGIIAGASMIMLAGLCNGVSVGASITSIVSVGASMALIVGVRVGASRGTSVGKMMDVSVGGYKSWFIYWYKCS